MRAATYLSAAEVRAHMTVMEAVALRMRRLITWRQCHRLCEPQLYEFAPRCQGCRHKLTVTPWIDGVRAYRCNWCSSGWRECQ